MTRRVATIANTKSGAKAAIQTALDAPVAANVGKAPSAGGSGDLYEDIAEAFADDMIRDDGEGDDAELTLPDPDDEADAIAEAEALIKAGKADGWRRQQGGIVATTKGRITKWTQPAARDSEKGTVASTQRVKAEGQRSRLSDLPYADRVDRRLRAFGRSLFGGKLSNAQLDVLRGAYVADRQRRGWKIPDWATIGENDGDEEGDD